MNVHNKTETDSDGQGTNQWLPGREARWVKRTKRYKLLCIKKNKQQEYTVQHREIQPIFQPNFME